MDIRPRNSASFVGGVLLVLFGLLALFSQMFRGFDFWSKFWPFIIIGVGAMFFAGMFAGGKSTSGLAIPGTIITGIGLMLFIQNITNYYESWSYGWAAIIIFVGLGIFIMGWFGGNSEQRRSGTGVMRVGLILLLIFGAFFEMIFNTSKLANYIFPAGLILLGLYLVFKRSSLLPGKRTEDQPKDTSG